LFHALLARDRESLLVDPSCFDVDEDGDDGLVRLLEPQRRPILTGLTYSDERSELFRDRSGGSSQLEGKRSYQRVARGFLELRARYCRNGRQKRGENTNSKDNSSGHGLSSLSPGLDTS